MADKNQPFGGGPMGSAPFNPDPPDFGKMAPGTKGAAGAPSFMNEGRLPGMGPAPMGNPMAAQPSFNQRRANAQALYGPGGRGWENFGFTPQGGPKTPDLGGAMAPPATRPMQPMGGGGISRPMEPQRPGGGMPSPGMMGPPVFQAPPGMGQPPGAGNLGPPQQGDPSQMFQQLFAQPGFLRMLMQYMGQQGGGRPGMGPQGGMGGPQGGADTPFRRGPVGGGGSGPFNPPMY